MAVASDLESAPARALHAHGARHDAHSDARPPMLVLQGLAGNAALATLLAPEPAPRGVQRLVRGGTITEPVAPSPIDAAAHPGLRAVRASVKSAASRASKHPKPSAAVKAATRAVEPGVDEAEAQAKTARVGGIEAAPTPPFDRAGFIAAVEAAIAKQAPKNLDEAANFASSGKADNVATEVRGRVTQSKDASTRPLAEASAKPPDTSAATITPGAPLPGAAPSPMPALDASRAAPTPAPAEQVDLDHGPAQVDAQMSEGGITDAQLRNANEPEFEAALGAKQQVAEHAAGAPAELRAKEAQVLAGAKQDAGATGKAGAAGLAAGHAGGVTRLLTGQQKKKHDEEKARAAVNAELRGIFDVTKTEVDGILGGIDTAVDTAFKEGEGKARTAFKQFHETEMAKFKDREYSGISGAAAWVADQFLGPPPGAKAVFDRSRAFYETEMKKVIGGIADLVGQRLTAAKERVARGRAEMKAKVASLDPSLRAAGQQSMQEFGSQFDTLDQSIDEKSQSVVDDLAEKYTTAKGEVDAEITAMQEASKGFIARAADAVGGVITTIKNLGTMLTQVLARAAAAVDKILSDPIGFLGNFVSAVKGGIEQFGEHVGAHVKAGLQAWLFGAVADAGIELPEKFDMKGVLQLVLSILGLTKEKVLARIAAKLPPGAIDKVIQGFGVVKTIVSAGISGLWQMLVEKIGDIKEMVMSQVEEMVSVEIIKAGIVWLVSMLNPASAFVKACKMIYDVVMFFVEKAAQIKEFVDSILDSVESIAAGGVGAVAGYIEKTLARMVPILIGFMASLIGLGGISGKIRAILEKIQAPVNKAIDWVVGKAVAFGKKALALGKKLLSKAKNLGKKVVGGIKKKLGIKEKTPEQIFEDKKRRPNRGVASAVSAANRLAGKPLIGKLLGPVLTALRLRHRLRVLELKPQGEVWAVHGAINPERTTQTRLPVRVDAITVHMQAEENPPDVNVDTTAKAGGAGKLRAAVDKAGGIVEFLKACASEAQMAGDMPTSEARNLYQTDTAARDYLKSEFRAARPFTHEWIPTNMMFDVVDRAIAAREKGSLDDWIGLQHKLRSPTRNVVWRIEYVSQTLKAAAHIGTFESLTRKLTRAKKALDEARMLVGPSAKKILESAEDQHAKAEGNVQQWGAGSASGIVTTSGSAAFHNRLREIYETHAKKSSPIKAYLSDLSNFVSTSVWDGSLPAGTSNNTPLGRVGIAVYIDDTAPRSDVTLGDLAAAQPAKKAEMLDLINGATG